MMVPTVERGLRLVVFCSMEMAGLRPSMESTSGPLHLIEELARVGRERFHVAALAFGVDGVEGERGFAGAAEAGDHGEGVARDLDVDVLEIVLACAVHGDALEHWVGIPF